MKTAILTNKNGKVLWTEGLLTFENLTTGATVCFSGSTEFTLFIGEGEGIRALPSQAFNLSSVECENRAIRLIYTLSSLTVTVVYESTEETFVKTVNVEGKDEINLKRIVLEGREVNYSTSVGGEGMPVFIGNEMWCGIEFPAANNRYFGKVLSFSQAPFETTCSFTSLPVVYGFNSQAELSDSFRKYIVSLYPKKQSVKIYCDWGLHDDLSDNVILTEKLTLDNIKTIGEFCAKSGTKFDYYLMDAFWFENNDPYKKFKATTFPNGPDGVVKAIADAGMKYGLWFDINFIHSHMKGWEEYECQIPSGAHCFALPKVAELMTEAIEYHIKEHGVKMLKLDFAYFECKNPTHGHSTEYIESKERSVKNYIKMIEHLREVEPELKVLCYNGWTTVLDWIGSVQDFAGHAISPYWVKYADYLYCGDPRPSEIATEDLSMSIVYYTDAMIRNFHDSYIPFDVIDDHGTMLGNTATIYGLGSAIYRCGALMNVLRGGSKVLLYGDLSNLSDDNCKYFGYVCSVYDRAMACDYRTSFILGNAKRGEVYGYSLSNASEGYAVAVNPTEEEQCVTLSLKEWKGVNVCVKHCIENGRIVEVDCKKVNGGYNLTLAPNGYVLVFWQILPAEEKPIITTLCKGETLYISAKTYKTAKLNFRKINSFSPIRTCLGYPEGLTVAADGKPISSTVKECIWSGVSWLYFDIKGRDELVISYEGEQPITLQYSLNKE